MSLRDELELELCTLSNDVGTILSVCQAAQIVDWLEQKLSEAQAETVERLANWLYAELKARTWHDKDDATAEVVAQKLRALSPDPEWLERQKKRWELEARLMEERVYGYHDPLTHTLDRKSGEAECSTCQRIADLERQLAALPEVKR